jgi:endonuclease/exonuclease/phosphatase family metal-dependent hydrolase
MNKISRFLLAALLCATSLHAQDAAPKPLRVAFWNLEWFPGGRPEATIAEAIPQIAQAMPAVAHIDADVIGLEEIHNWDAGAIAVAKAEGTKVQVASEFLDEKGVKTIQQLVIASRLPAIGGWAETWGTGNGITPTRGFAFAAYQPTPGHVLLVYCVHLKSNRGEITQNVPMREESARQLLSHVAAMEKAYAPLGTVSVVIGGDFNTSLDDPKFAAEKTLPILTQAGFQAAWENVPFKDRVTLPTKPSRDPKFPPFPDACFDHVFVKGAKINAARIEIPDPAPSDHRPVIVEITLPTSAQ